MSGSFSRHYHRTEDKFGAAGSASDPTTVSLTPQRDHWTGRGCLCEGEGPWTQTCFGSAAQSCPIPFATPKTVAHQVPLPMGFSRQEYWSGLPFPSAGDLLDLGVQPASPVSAGGSFITEAPGMPGYPGSIPRQGTKISQLVILSASLQAALCICVCVCVSGTLWNDNEQHTRASASQNKWFWGMATSHRDLYLVFTRMLFLGLAGILSWPMKLKTIIIFLKSSPSCGLGKGEGENEIATLRYIHDCVSSR